MAAIKQQNLFTWEDVEARSDLDRLTLARDHLPDEQIIQYLEVMRGKAKMQTRVGLALAIMMAMALGHVKADRKEQMRSLVQPIPATG